MQLHQSLSSGSKYIFYFLFYFQLRYIIIVGIYSGFHLYGYNVSMQSVALTLSGPSYTINAISHCTVESQAVDSYTRLFTDPSNLPLDN